MLSTSEWLHTLGLGQYVQVFADNDVDLELISSLSEQDLEKLGVFSLGHRKKLLKAISELRNATSPEQSPPPSPRQYTPAHLAERILTSRSALEGERKLVSVLFCDIAQSTELAAKLGADAMHGLLNRFFELSLDEVHRFEGTINQFLGDGFMALFGAPLAHEDHPRRALLAALALQQRLREARADEPNLREVRVRMGVNTGMVVVGKIGDNLRMDYTAVGDTTHLAARLQQGAAPDTIRVSSATQRAAAAFFEFKSLGTHSLKGIAEPLELYDLVKARSASETGASTASGGIGSPLVGREGELAVITESVKSLHQGQGCIMLLTGEPGVGKSRLLAETRRSANAVGIHWLEGRSLSFGRNLSYWPFIGILKQVFDIDEADAEAQVWGKLERGCAQLFAERAEEIAPYLGIVLRLEMTTAHEQRVKYLDPRALGRQVFLSMRQLLERLATRQPLLVLMEDWHWADHSSVKLCEHLLPLVGGSALSFWFAARPEPKEPIGHMRAAASAGEKPLPTQEIALAPLAETQSGLLLDNLVGAGNLPETLRNQILRKTEGNPFFMEEMIRALVAEGALIQDTRTHAWRLSKPVETLALPDTVQGVIVARVDRLEEGVKDSLKLASVIGRNFFLRILQAISKAGNALDSSLEHLQRAELIRLRQQLPELEYIFKHALVQEAAYGSIVVERRKSIHQAVAKAIETLFAERLEEFTSMLAYHYARAEDWDKAQAYLFKAGDQAGRMAADAEALEHYRQAIIAHERAFGDRWAPLQRARLYRQMGEALSRIGQFPQALTFLGNALTHLGRHYPTSRGRVRMEVGTQLLQRLLAVVVPRATWLHTNRGVANPEIAMEAFRAVLALGWIDIFQDGERMALDILRMARYSYESRDPEQSAISAGYLGLLFNILGMHTIARHYHERAVPIAKDCGSPVALGHTCFAYGQGGYYAGRWEEALANVERGAEAFRGIRHFHLWGGPAIWSVIVRLAMGDSKTTAISQEIVDTGIETGDSELEGWGLVGLGMSLRHAGDYNSAIRAFEAAVPIFESVSDPHNLTLTLAESALCFARSGRFEQALHLADRVLLRVTEGNPKGLWKVHAHGPAAEAYVLAAEGIRKRRLLEKALSLVRDAVRQGGAIRSAWAPHSMRLLGSCRWLAGDSARAKSAWRRAAATAKQLGAHYALAEIYLETGRRLNRATDLERAVELFNATGFVLRATEAQEHLSGVSKRVANA